MSKEPIAYLTRNEEGDPAMLFFDRQEARAYCEADTEPEGMCLASERDELLEALRRAALALAFAAETSAAMEDDYRAVSAAIAKATGARHG